MIKSTKIAVDIQKIQQIAQEDIKGKIPLNDPTGDFFYDPWKVKSQYQGSIYEELLNALPAPIGEARVITLESGTCYFSHSDIDDRYHLNISGDCSALVNLETGENWFLSNDGVWYDMDAGPRHSAVNFGQYPRKQIVVRKLLTRNNLQEPNRITINIKGENPRFLFDNTLSSWLNCANKAGIISNFQATQSSVSFDVEKAVCKELENLIPESFEYEYR